MSDLEPVNTVFGPFHRDPVQEHYAPLMQEFLTQAYLHDPPLRIRMPPAEPGTLPAEPVAITAHKRVMYLPVATELLMSEGLIPDTRPPVVIARRQRILWALKEHVQRVRLRVGSWIAGENLDRRDYEDG